MALLAGELQGHARPRHGLASEDVRGHLPQAHTQGTLTQPGACIVGGSGSGPCYSLRLCVLAPILPRPGWVRAVPQSRSVAPGTRTNSFPSWGSGGAAGRAVSSDGEGVVSGSGAALSWPHLCKGFCVTAPCGAGGQALGVGILRWHRMDSDPPGSFLVPNHGESKVSFSINSGCWRIR